MLTLKFFKREPKDWTTTEIEVLEVRSVKINRTGGETPSGYNVQYTDGNGIYTCQFVQMYDPEKRDPECWDWCVVENAAGRTTQKLDPAAPDRLAA